MSALLITANNTTQQVSSWTKGTTEGGEKKKIISSWGGLDWLHCTSMYSLVGQEPGSVVLHQRPQVVRCAEQFLHLVAVAFKVLGQHVPAATRQGEGEREGEGEERRKCGGIWSGSDEDASSVFLARADTSTPAPRNERQLWVIHEAHTWCGAAGPAAPRSPLWEKEDFWPSGSWSSPAGPGPCCTRPPGCRGGSASSESTLVAERGKAEGGLWGNGVTLYLGRGDSGEQYRVVSSHSFLAFLFPSMVDTFITAVKWLFLQFIAESP